MFGSFVVKTLVGATAGALLAVVAVGQEIVELRGSLAPPAHDAFSIRGDAGDIIFNAVAAAREEKVRLSDLTDPGERMLYSTPDEIEPYFDLYLYVSKAAEGSVAQRMFLYERGFDGRLSLTDTWLVSTGREKREKTPSGRTTFTDTPEGLFKLDPKRFHRNWRSRTWNADMPWTMFFDFVERGGPSGLAIHAAGRSKIKQLGSRASGGCIRLAPDHAKALFRLIQNKYAGIVPVFAMSGDSTSTVGRPARDRYGAMLLTSGYRVLLQIEDYEGGSAPLLSLAAMGGVGLSRR